MVTVDSLRADDPQEGWAGDPGSQVGVTWPPQAPEPPGREREGMGGFCSGRAGLHSAEEETRGHPGVPHSTREPPARSPSLLAYLPQTPGPRPQAVGVPLPGDQVDNPSSPMAPTSTVKPPTTVCQRCPCRHRRLGVQERIGHAGLPGTAGPLCPCSLPLTLRVPSTCLPAGRHTPSPPRER